MNGPPPTKNLTIEWSWDERWRAGRQESNSERPHSGLDYLEPEAFRQATTRLTASFPT